jgi:hypothetical protein
VPLNSISVGIGIIVVAIGIGIIVVAIGVVGVIVVAIGIGIVAIGIGIIVVAVAIGVIVVAIGVSIVAVGSCSYTGGRISGRRQGLSNGAVLRRYCAAACCQCEGQQHQRDYHPHTSHA